ncbi:hypothetical protein Sjap_018398 [Stephania japonica]|uniref:Uncharacterized protein n=1 Tax=Stephania japonica TaxID=461633 RepID=A0AAP0I7Y3_9MAGN
MEGYASQLISWFQFLKKQYLLVERPVLIIHNSQHILIMEESKHEKVQMLNFPGMKTLHMEVRVSLIAPKSLETTNQYLCSVGLRLSIIVIFYNQTLHFILHNLQICIVCTRILFRRRTRHSTQKQE